MIARSHNKCILVSPNCLSKQKTCLSALKKSNQYSLPALILPEFRILAILIGVLWYSVVLICISLITSIMEHLCMFKASLIAQLVKNLPAMWETPVQFLGWEDPLEKGQATHFSILAWRIPWTVHGIAKSQTQLSGFQIFICLFAICISSLMTYVLRSLLRCLLRSKKC